jgi:hypothetical protein
MSPLASPCPPQLKGELMAVLNVGIGEEYNTIQAAVNAAESGDTINVDAGTYTNDYASISKNITLQGVGGMVHLVSTGLIPNGKAIFIVNGNVTINNFEFSGARVADNNGEGIRFESGNLVLSDCYFSRQSGRDTDRIERYPDNQ